MSQLAIRRLATPERSIRLLNGSRREAVKRTITPPRCLGLASQGILARPYKIKRAKMEGESPTQASALAGAVFLSYASQDAEAAQKICDALRAAGVEVWFDKSELRGGDVWDRQIREQIHSCRLFIAIVSANTEARDEGYFRREWGFATDRSRDIAEKRVFLIPVVIDDTPERGASVPDKFHQIQWTRLPGGVTPAAFVARIAGLLGAPAPVAPANRAASAPANAPPAHTLNQRSLRLVFGLAAVAVIAGGGWFALQHSAPHRHAKEGVSGQSQPAVIEKSIAVLPFADMSENKNQEYFGDGMAEEVIDRLAQLAQLRVISRTSAFQFKGKNEDVRTIGARLAVANILEGSVRRSGDRLRVSVQLVNAADGSQLWSQSYDRNARDIFQVQDEIAGEVVKALRLRLAAPLEAEHATTENPAAHNLLLQGRFFEDRWAQGDSERAIAAYEHALKEDPGYALAWAELAWAEMWLRPPDVQRATSSAQRAIELRPDLAQAHATRGWYESLLGFDWDAADQEFDKALALDPQNMRGLYGKGRLARVLRRTEDSLRYYHAALDRDPVNAFAFEGLSATLTALGHNAEAVQAARKALDISPSIEEGHWYLAYALLWNGELEAARREIGLEPNSSMRLSGIALIERARKNQEASDTALQELLADTDAPKDYFVAAVYANRRDVSAAINWLERARAAYNGFFGEVTTDPAFDAIRSVPAFVAYLHGLKLPD